MKRTIALAVTLAAVGIGCGSSGQQQPDQANGSGSRPPEGFRTAGRTGQPENYEQAKKAQRASGTDDYDYVHAHFSVDTPSPDDPRTGCTADWATNQQGSCSGRFIGGSQPFNYVGGKTRWQRLGQRVPRDLRSVPGARESGILIAQETESGQRVECLITDRSRGDCLTNSEQAGKPPNTEGGPLYLDAEFGRSPYVLLRGWCKKGDRLCTPH